MSDAPVAPLLLDPHDPATQRDPYPAYDRLRRERPVHTMPDGAVVVSRHTDVVALLRSGTLSSAQQPGAAGAPVAALAEHSAAVMIASDPPAHTRRRAAVAPSLHPSALRPLAPSLDAEVSGLLDQLSAALDTGPTDVVATLTGVLPARVLLWLLGADPAGADRIRAWTADFSDGISPWAGEDGERRAGAALEALARHLRAELDLRAGEGTTGLLAELARSPGLDEDEALQQAVLLCTAGLDTTADLLASAIAAALAHPATWAALVADPAGQAPAVVEETLRWESPVQFAMRRLGDDARVGATWLPRGTAVLLALGAANRDPAVFGHAERFEPERMRRGERRHLAFGGGIHRCLGAPLARLQGAALVAALAAREPHLELVEPPVARPRLFLRGPARVVVRRRRPPGLSPG